MTQGAHPIRAPDVDPTTNRLPYGIFQQKGRVRRTHAHNTMNIIPSIKDSRSFVLLSALNHALARSRILAFSAITVLPNDAIRTMITKGGTTAIFDITQTDVVMMIAADGMTETTDLGAKISDGILHLRKTVIDRLKSLFTAQSGRICAHTETDRFGNAVSAIYLAEEGMLRMTTIPSDIINSQTDDVVSRFRIRTPKHKHTIDVSHVLRADKITSELRFGNIGINWKNGNLSDILYYGSKGAEPLSKKTMRLIDMNLIRTENLENAILALIPTRFSPLRKKTAEQEKEVQKNAAPEVSEVTKSTAVTLLLPPPAPAATTDNAEPETLKV